MGSEMLYVATFIFKCIHCMCCALFLDRVVGVALNTGKPVGETILYFGCRHRNEDYIYEEELAKYKDEGLLTKLYVAFSRDQAQKVYVQHLLEQNGEEVWKILDKGGHIYVCGSV